MVTRVHVGTVGFRHPHWVGAMYPPHARVEQQLEAFTGRLDAVELFLEGIDDLRAMARWEGRSVRVLVTLPRAWLHLPGGRLPFHPGLDLLEDLATQGTLAGVRLPLDDRLPPTRTNAVHLRKLAKVFADLGLAIDLPRGPWQDPDVVAWLDRIGVAVCWRADPRHLSPPVIAGPPGVIRIPAPRRPRSRHGAGMLRRLLPGLRRLADRHFDLLVLLEDAGHGDATCADALELRELLARRGGDREADPGDARVGPPLV